MKGQEGPEVPPQFPASDYQLGWRVYLVHHLVYKYSLVWTVETNPRVKRKQTKGIPGLEDHTAQKVPQMSGCKYSRASEGEALTGFETHSHSCGQVTWHAVTRHVFMAYQYPPLDWKQPGARSCSYPVPWI